jgi:very-short-patch-repair endonuclease
MTQRARRLRRDATFPERLLWSRLRNQQVSGAKFRRQHVIGRYVADSLCPQHKLVIELDGHSHDMTAPADLKREGYLLDQGFRVIRFRNDEVVHNVGGVLEAIANAVDADRPRQA